MNQTIRATIMIATMAPPTSHQLTSSGGVTRIGVGVGVGVGVGAGAGGGAVAGVGVGAGAGVRVGVAIGAALTLNVPDKPSILTG